MDIIDCNQAAHWSANSNLRDFFYFLAWMAHMMVEARSVVGPQSEDKLFFDWAAVERKPIINLVTRTRGDWGHVNKAVHAKFITQTMYRCEGCDAWTGDNLGCDCGGWDL